MSDKATTTEPTQEEMCRAIAEKVMGHKIRRHTSQVSQHGRTWDEVTFSVHKKGEGFYAIPDYFTDPAAMVEVMEKIGGMSEDASLELFTSDSELGWACATPFGQCCEGPTPMHAVALAAYALAMTRTYNRRLDDAGK